VSNKETILGALQDEITKLKEAYEAFKNLPERVFDTMYSSITHHDIGKYNIAQPANNSHDNGKDREDKFGGNKGVVHGIIVSEGKAIRKRDILRKFQILCPKVKKPVDAVTFALSGLRTGGIIKSYNPTTSVKSGYWTLMDWWNGDELLDSYIPEEATTRLFG
jgi:hypothetical protein